MDSKTKMKVRRRILTLMSKIQELREIGQQDAEISNALPYNFEEWQSDLMDIYAELS